MKTKDGRDETIKFKETVRKERKIETDGKVRKIETESQVPVMINERYNCPSVIQ